MKIRFHGAVEGVTGSCYELCDKGLGVHILVDCGMFQGEPARESRNHGKLPFDADRLTHVLVTHAHLDHVGLLPLLYKNGFTGSVYALTETRDLARIVLADAAKISKVYDQDDIDAIKWHEPSAAVFGNACPIAPDVFVRFFRSGHILGAASITIMWGPRDQQRSITFSGDVGVNADEREIMPLLGYRMSPVRADWLVVESTYGGVERPPETMEDRLGNLAAKIDAALFDRGGVVIMPAFAIGRTQEVLCDLSILFARYPERYAHVPVYVDSPLGRTAGRILVTHIGRTYRCARGTKVRNAWLGAAFFRALGLDKDSPDHMDIAIDCLNETFRHEAPKLPRPEGLARNWRCITQHAPKPEAGPVEGPAIIIAGAGMCDAGPVQRHLRDHLRNPAATILFTGYCGQSTLGGVLQAHGRLDPHERRRDRSPVVVGGETFEARHIQATIDRISGYSAHADQPGLLDWMWSGKPGEPKACIGRQVFVTHGDMTPRKALKGAIEAKAAAHGETVTVHVPREDGEWHMLD